MRSARALAVVLGLLGGCAETRGGGFSNVLPDDATAAADVTVEDLPAVTDATVADLTAPADLPTPREGAPTDAGVAAPAATDARADVSAVDVRPTDVPAAVDGGVCGARDLGARTGPALATGATSGGPSTLEGTCGGDAVDEAVFTWVAPSDGDYDFTTDGSDFDTVIYVRDGLCTESELACNDDDESLQGRVIVPLGAGQRVTVVVDGYDTNAGNYVLGITPVGAADAGAPTD
jgi:hypothetical protein